VAKRCKVRGAERTGCASIISYQHAYELVRSHGESGTTAGLLPFTVDRLIWAASMVVLDASRYQGWPRGVRSAPWSALGRPWR
jgi:hypothetical protein